MTGFGVVIVTTREANLTKCLSSLSAQTFADFEAIVVCSGANVPERLDRFVDGKLVNRTRFVATANRGYGAACNKGARLSSASFLIFLNDDTSLNADYLKELYGSLSKDENRIYQSLILHEYAQRAMRGNPCDIYGAAGLGFYGNCGSGEFYASGASFAISKKVFYRLGGFDEELFLYYDDVDLNWRARLMGFGISAVESAVCHHAGGASSRTIPHANKFYLTQRNRIRVMIKNYSTRRILTRLPITCTLIITGGVFLALKSRRVHYVASAFKALIWNISMLQNTLIHRNVVQRSRVKDDKTVEKAMTKHSMDICVLKQYIATRTSDLDEPRSVGKRTSSRRFQSALTVTF
jgi:GT2 family glycosyltransferase